MSDEHTVVRAAYTRELHPLSKPRRLSVLPSTVRSAEDWHHIQQGHRSAGTDDRWDVVVEDTTAYWYRAGSGYCVFAATFASDRDGWRVVKALVEEDPARYLHTSDKQDSELLDLLVDSLLRSR